MRPAVAIDQMCGAATGTIIFDAVNHGLFDFRVVGQPQIIIAAEADNGFIINSHFNLLCTVGNAPCAV